MLSRALLAVLLGQDGGLRGRGVGGDGARDSARGSARDTALGGARGGALEGVRGGALGGVLGGALWGALGEVDAATLLVPLEQEVAAGAAEDGVLGG